MVTRNPIQGVCRPPLTTELVGITSRSSCCFKEMLASSYGDSEVNSHLSQWLSTVVHDKRADSLNRVHSCLVAAKQDLAAYCMEGIRNLLTGQQMNAKRWLLQSAGL